MPWWLDKYGITALQMVTLCVIFAVSGFQPLYKKYYCKTWLLKFYVYTHIPKGQFLGLKPKKKKKKKKPKQNKNFYTLTVNKTTTDEVIQIWTIILKSSKL